MTPFLNPTGILVALAFLAIVWGHGWKTGWSQRSDRAEQAQLVAERVHAQTVKKKKEIKEVAVNHYIDRVRTVVEKGDTIIKEVPVYVTEKADTQCTFTRGFVGLYNAAASGEPLRTSPGDPDAPAEGLKASTVAAATADNFKICHENAEQLIHLQEVVRKLSRP